MNSLSRSFWQFFTLKRFKNKGIFLYLPLYTHIFLYIVRTDFLNNWETCERNSIETNESAHFRG